MPTEQAISNFVTAIPKCFGRYMAVKKELQDLGVAKIPSSNKIQKRIENLEYEQAATVREKQQLQKKQNTLDIIRQNFTALLNAPTFRESIENKRENIL